MKELAGQKFNRWYIVRYMESRLRRGRKQHFWQMRCDCGTEVVRSAEHVVAGRSKSCGCLHRENLAKRNKKHGKAKTPEYVIWKAIHQRCENPRHAAFSRYGGRGIVVCARWSGENGFWNFITDMGLRPSENQTVERGDNDKGYLPDNCSWASRKTQNRNKRSNLNVTFQGRTQCLSAWAEEFGIAQSALYYRIVTAKWSVEKALTTPSRGTSKRTITYKGTTDNVNGWSRRTGIPPATIRWRLDAGKKLREVLQEWS